MSRRFIILFAGLLMSMSAFSVDIMLPAFHQMAEDLVSPLSRVQLTVVLYSFSFGFGQIFMGPLADRFGRRPTLLFGMGLYLCGALFGILGSNIEAVILGRILQGFGGAASHIVARAVLRDLYSGRDLAQMMSWANAVFAFGPLVAPLLGAGMVEFAHWRFVFVAMAIFVGSLAVCTIYVYQETLDKPDPRALQLGRFIAGTRRVFKNPQSRFYILISSLAYMTIVYYIANASRLYVEGLGTSETEFAIVFALSGLGIVAGQYVNTYCIRRWGTEVATGILAVAMLFVLSSLVGFVLAGRFSILVLMFHTFAYLMCFQSIYANGASLTLDPHKEIAGLTSSVFGFCAHFLSNGAFIVLGLSFDGSPLRWAMGMFLIGAILVGCLAVGAISTRFGSARRSDSGV
jgi:DHA1 family bicyclomycin/chloramphenicol resistance-like MFS transporter